MCPRLASAEEAEIIADRILTSFATPFNFKNEPAYLSASIGIAVAEPGAATDAATMVRDADTALYKAKGAGRAQAVAYRPEMRSVSGDQLGTELALREAIASQELVTYFQPVYSPNEGRYVGTEALVRWNHDGRLVPPGEFIPVAEESGLIHEIGAWVMLDACRRTMHWNAGRSDEERMHVAVNVSARQFSRVDFVRRVERILRLSEIPSEDVVVELTETSIMHEDESTLDRLHELKHLGVQIAIDDFGTGYSSLNYLRQLPVDIIKIDRSFISQLEHDAATVAIVDTITSLAHTLGKKVVAEGVESEVQLDVLVQIGCDLVQGFFFEKPVPHDQIERIFIEGPSVDLRRFA